MRSEALDITIETRNNLLWFNLSGPFHNEQIPNIREKLEGLIRDGHRQLVINLEQVMEIEEPAVTMLVSFVNTIRGKNGDVRFIFKNPVVGRVFAPYKNIVSIFPDESSLLRGGFLKNLIYRRKQLARKTGIRLSRNVAVLLLFVLGGWFLSLFFIIHLQNERIKEQEYELTELKLFKERNLLKLERLQARIKPLEQLGVLDETFPDSADSRR